MQYYDGHCCNCDRRLSDRRDGRCRPRLLRGQVESRQFQCRRVRFPRRRAQHLFHGHRRRRHLFLRHVPLPQQVRDGPATGGRAPDPVFDLGSDLSLPFFYPRLSSERCDFFRLPFDGRRVVPVDGRRFRDQRLEEGALALERQDAQGAKPVDIFGSDRRYQAITECCKLGLVRSVCNRLESKVPLRQHRLDVTLPDSHLWGCASES